VGGEKIHKAFPSLGEIGLHVRRPRSKKLQVSETENKGRPKKGPGRSGGKNKRAVVWYGNVKKTTIIVPAQPRKVLPIWAKGGGGESRILAPPQKQG